MFWIIKYEESRGNLGGCIYNAPQNVRTRRSQKAIQEEQKRWNNLRLHYEFETDVGSGDPDSAPGDVWRRHDPERPETALLKVDLERLKAREPILRLIEDGYTQAHIGQILGIDQRRVSERIQKIVKWYRSH